MKRSRRDLFENTFFNAELVFGTRSARRRTFFHFRSEFAAEFFVFSRRIFSVSHAGFCFLFIFHAHFFPRVVFRVVFDGVIA